jgi:chemotaxis protein MotB
MLAANPHTSAGAACPRPRSGWEENALWLMSLGDLMLLLLCFFVLLSAIDRRPTPPAEEMATPSAKTNTPRTPKRASDRGSRPTVPLDDRIAHAFTQAKSPVAASPKVGSAAVAAELRTIFRPAGDRVEIHARPGLVTVSLQDSITFASGSAALLPGVRPLLDRTGILLASRGGFRVEISGHTDDIPITTSQYPSNWELSAARAAAVARQLLDGAPLDPARLRIVGYGEHHPLDIGLTSEARARNRRVELRIVL